MARVIEVSREELTERRARLLDRVGSDSDDLAARAERGDLRGDEWVVWEELRSIDFLLGDDTAES